MYRRNRRFLIALLIPAVLFGLVVLVYPIYLVVDASVHNVQILNVSALNASPISGANYRALAHDPAFGAALWVSFVYTFGSTIPAFLLGLGLALLLNQAFPLRRIIRTLVLLPWAIPGVVASILFLWMLNASYGVVNYILFHIGLISSYVPWLASTRWSILGVIFPTIWKSYPFFCLLLLAALQAVPRELYEAARVDGAGRWQAFKRVTWPGVRPMAYLAFVLQVLWAFREFEVIYPMTGGGPGTSTQTLAIYLYNQAFQFFHMGYASTLGVLTIGICVIVVAVSYPRLRRSLWR